jgi:hypothetical protein
MVCPCGLVSGAGAPMQLLADQLEFALLSSPGGYGSKKNENIYIYICIVFLRAEVETTRDEGIEAE